jgi:hypothetical protein
MSNNRIIGWTPMKFNFEIDDEDDDLDDDDEVDFDEDEDEDVKAIFMKIPKVLNTPLGLYKIDDTLNPFRYFDFWMGSCNFNITPQILIDLEQTPGVEKLRILTRYSFLIGVGRMFDFRDVRTSIQEKLCANKTETITIHNIETKTDLIKEYEHLIENRYWAALVLPNGKIETASSNELDEDFLCMIELFKESRDNCDSIIYCSNEELLEDNEKRS